MSHLKFRPAFFVLPLILFFAHTVYCADSFQSELKSHGVFFLVGTETGLYEFTGFQSVNPLWRGGEVKKAVPVPYGIFLLTSDGIYFSDNLRDFKAMNNGLNVKTVKIFRDGEKSFSNIIQDLKDLKADPSNPSNLVTCSKDGVFYSLNAGNKWNYLPNPTIAPGIKSVAIVSRPELTLFLAHPFKGIYKKNLTQNGPWTEISKGILEASQSYEEISDILPVPDDNGIKIFAANNFSPNLYQYREQSRSWTNLYRSRENFNLMESLFEKNGSFYFVSTNGIMKLEKGQEAPEMISQNFLREIRQKIEPSRNGRIFSLTLFSDGKTELNLSELWISGDPSYRPTVVQAMNRKGLYVQAGYLKKKKQLDGLLELMDKTGQNALIIDMKDDWGKLRFSPESPILRKMGQEGSTLDLESFTKSMKEKNIYLIARLVLFQDRILYSYKNFTFAVKSRSSGGPWQGRKKQKDGSVKVIQEYWVDPYSEKVWEYNVEIAKELVRRGFDEVQFDYVRFTTDGDNLGDTYYSFQDKGMDKESAILSFLIYARENIPAPISIDIYGANGWWRTSARTGQDVELFRNYVDAICPMYYPSHFDPSFEYYEPFDKRTYRIYLNGSMRNYFFGRKSIVVRPYIQAFKMNYLKYDRTYYGPDYIRNEVEGVMDSVNMGYTFWNMGVKYQILTSVFPIKNNQK